MFLLKGEQLMILLGILAPGLSIALLRSRVLPSPLSPLAMLNLARSARQPGAVLRPAF